MKFISFLFSLFFALLVTIPCNDEVSAKTIPSELSVEKNANPSHETHSDFCSVFCSCSCCRTVMVLDYNIAEIKDIDHLEDYSKITDFQKFTLSKIPFGIWQPPKLS